jgi:hypothetical protein
MHINQYVIIFYILFWLVRMNGCFRPVILGSICLLLLAVVSVRCCRI